MRITFIIDNLTSGGKEKQLGYLLSEISKEQNIQLIVFNQDIFYEEILNQPISIKVIQKNTKYSLKTLKIIYRAIKKFQPSLIHSWSNYISLFSLPYLILHPKVKLISSIRYAGKLKKTLLSSLIKRLAWSRSIAIVSNSKRGLTVENMFKNKKGFVIYNGLDIKYFDFYTGKQNQNEKFFYDRFKVKVVMIGRFYSAKDYTTFIKAAKIVSLINKDICFICIGDGPNKREAEKAAGDLLNNNICFLGNRSDINILLKDMDVGVLLTNINGHAEGISNAIMEYMAAGLPVIATNAGGTPELVQDNISGFLVPAFDENKVVEKILYLINNQNRARDMGNIGREIIEKNFSIRKMTTAYMNLYTALVREK